MIEKFMTKKGREVEICLIEKSDLPELLNYANRLIEDDTFLMFGENPMTLDEEEKYLNNLIENVNNKNVLAVFAKYDGKIIGYCDVYKGQNRKSHVGNIGLSVDRDFREEGLGSYLLKYILTHVCELSIKIVTVGVFANNNRAIHIYEKMGFKEYGRLPKALLYRGEYVDEVFMKKEVRE